MAGTIAASPKVASTVGLKDVVIAELTEDTEATLTYGDLHAALQIGKVKRSSKRGRHITIGVHRKDWHNEDYYPAYVEYGHGGPGPAPAHPYIRPAYDTRQDEAYEIIRNGLRDAIDQM